MACKNVAHGKFNIGDEQALYRLEVGSYSGTAGDSLAYHNNMAFTSKDRDNDRHGGVNCAVSFTGAWWYRTCLYSNLNGKYLGDTIQKNISSRKVFDKSFSNNLSNLKSYCKSQWNFWIHK